MDRNNANRGSAQSINWRKGTLCPYESMAGIGAKFCFLNRVSPPLFRDYLTTLSQKFASAEFLFLMDRPQTDIAKFAIDLGEPLDKVRELRVGRFFPPSDYFYASSQRFWPPRTCHGVPQNWHWTVSYCPVCVRHGFHASFHQIDLFSRCLLHGEGLKKFEAKRAYWNYMRPDERFIGDVYELLFEGESRWNFSQPDEWLPHAEVKNLKAVRKYLSLVDEAWQKVSALYELWVGGYSPNTSTSKELDVLHCHQWPAPFPKMLARCFSQEAGPATLTTKVFLNPGFNNFRRKVTDIQTLVEARRQWVLLLREDATWLKWAVKAIEDMIFGQELSQVAYRHFRDLKPIGHREAFDSHFKRLIPRLVAIQYLQDKWLTPYYLKSRPRLERFSDTMASYIAIGRALEARGLAKKVLVDFMCAKVGQAPRLFHQDAYQIDESLKELTDIVLSAELLDDIWNAWDLEDQAAVGRPNLPRYGTSWCVLDMPPRKLELRLWSRTPSLLPIWNRIHSDQHSDAERMWKYGTLESLQRAGKFSLHWQWMHPEEADDLASNNWKNYGSTIVNRFHH